MAFCNDKTVSDLEWPRLLAALASFCRGEPGRRRALTLPFADTREGAVTALAEVREASHALDEGDPLPLEGLRDVEDAVARVSIDGVLSAPELRDVGATLASARVLRRYLSARRGAMPALAAACLSDPTLDAVEDEINDAFDVDGTLSDNASPRLHELRTEYRAARARVISRLEELMRRHAAVLQDAFWTEREGRYVLPMRTDAHERVPGIVHATSSSGATLFVEPRVIVALGNRLKVLEGEVRREEEAIYARLSGLLDEQAASVRAAFGALVHADVRAAAAHLRARLDLVFIDVAEGPRAELRAARHPLLALDGVEVVASDVAVTAGRALVVSGPNAGGKTVALKSVGLAALMLRAGLPLACAEGSVMGAFDTVLTDVGDDQSLRQNLSTFSAHVKNLAGILGASSRGALVLLDEVATGTDPREGEALAAAVLDGLCSRGAAVMCTTHYEGLKVLAVADERFTNASVGFDVATMSPTFELITGIPGQSSALVVAERFGVPEDVLARARAFLSREHNDFERLVERLHDERRALALARSDAERAAREADARAAILAAETVRMRARDEAALDKELETLRSSVRRARDELREAQTALRQKRHDEAALRSAAKLVDRLADKVAVGGEFDPHPAAPPTAPAGADDLRKGARVFVPRLRAEADVTDVLGDGQLRVVAGGLKIIVRADEVRPARPDTPPAKARHDKTPSRPRLAVSHATPAGKPRSAPSPSNTCDVRGMRPDDAASMAEQFVDRLIGAAQRVGYILHGDGAGALRDAVRARLRDHRAVSSLRPGESGEGGAGVSVIYVA